LVMKILLFFAVSLNVFANPAGEAARAILEN
jgi:hypothetical protein